MITKEKSIVLQMFSNSRFDVNIAPQEVCGVAIDDCEELNDTIETVVSNILSFQKNNGYTLNNLNNMKYSYASCMMAYYYNLILNEYEKHIKEGDEVIEAVIGLAILTHLKQEKGFNIGLNDIQINTILDYFETRASDRKLVMRMFEVAFKLVERIEKANYTLYLKQKRKK